MYLIMFGLGFFKFVFLSLFFSSNCTIFAGELVPFQKFQSLTYSLELSPQAQSILLKDDQNKLLSISNAALELIHKISLDDIKINERSKDAPTTDFSVTINFMEGDLVSNPYNYEVRHSPDITKYSQFHTQVIRRNGEDIINMVINWDRVIYNKFKEEGSIEYFLEFSINLAQEIYGKVSHIVKLKKRTSHKKLINNAEPTKIKTNEDLEVGIKASERVISFINLLIKKYKPFLSLSQNEMLIDELEKEKRILGYMNRGDQNVTGKVITFPSKPASCNLFF